MKLSQRKSRQQKPSVSTLPGVVLERLPTLSPGTAWDRGRPARMTAHSDVVLLAKTSRLKVEASV
jgi:hypothetical protein